MSKIFAFCSIENLVGGSSLSYSSWCHPAILWLFWVTDLWRDGKHFARVSSPLLGSKGEFRHRSTSLKCRSKKTSLRDSSFTKILTCCKNIPGFYLFIYFLCLLRRGRVWKRNLRWPSWQPSYPPARPASVLFHPRLSGPVPAPPPHQRPLPSCPRCLRGPGCAEPDSETPFQRRPLRLSCCRGERTREDVWEGRCQPRAPGAAHV